MATKFNIMAIALAGSAVVCATSAYAAPVVSLTPTGTACASTDISPNATACTGFYKGNLINGSPTDINLQKQALALIGLTWDGTWMEKIDGLGGSQTVDFTTPLNGTTWIGIHYGAGVGGPGGTDSTAFYKLEAGSNLDKIMLAYKASSNAALYFTGPGSGVPEASTWAMLILGVGAIGGALRRKRQRTSVNYSFA